MLLLHPDRNPLPGATAQFQAMQDEYRDLPVLLKYLPYMSEPQVIYIPERKTSIWDVVQTVAKSIPPERYTEGLKLAARLFTKKMLL